MVPHNLYWGEAHHNTYQFGRQSPSISEICEIAANHLDFYGAAYYTACADAFERGGHPGEHRGKQGLILERWKEAAQLVSEWAEVEQATAHHHRPGKFVTFPGYEWQGDGRCGDHNVIHFEEGHPIVRVMTVEELYEKLRPIRAVAIPHHTAYMPGYRSPRWSSCNERLSPFVEIFSVHGCSETDEEWIGLRQNPLMGPGTAGSTYQEALDLGLHLGAICSTDNWSNMPGCYGQGLMGVWSEQLNRESLWEAFAARRVYGVSGDRIKLEFTVNNFPMGSIGKVSGKRTIAVKVVGSDALDRIEILRNGQVLSSHCHQGTWSPPRPGRRGRFKWRIEAGWGPPSNVLDLGDRIWQGKLSVAGAKMLGWEPCWITPSQQRPSLSAEHATFTMCSSASTVHAPHQNATVFEFESASDAPCRLELNGLVHESTVLECAGASRIMRFTDECVQMLESHFDLKPHSHERADPYHAMAYRAKLHRIIPEAGYNAEFVYEDDDRLSGETHYRVRVEQRNGQRAWSSPIWIVGRDR